ncbi:MAG: M28 family peptidase [Gammaproteobacteria bacterium]|nr:M28 family peptidase [Gammaproteobacteria bacterium]
MTLLSIQSAYRVALAAAVLSLAACSGTQRESLPPPILAVDYERHIVALASDEFEGRKPGTAGERKTVDYLISEFKKLGLEPGNGDSWVQRVPIVEITAGSDASLNFGAMQFAYGKDMVIWTKRPVAEVKVTDSPLVFVGHGVVAPEYGWNDYAGVDMRGKTAVILINDPGFATGDANLFRGRAMTYYGRWTYKFEEAARQGAAAAIIIHDDKPAAYPWDTVQNSWMGAQLDTASADDNAGRAAIEGWITRTAGDALLKANGHSYEQLLMAASQPSFKPILLAERAGGFVRNAIRRSVSPNVVATLKGSKRPYEYIVYMAHWDHLGKTLARSGDNIFNGALDNATGISGLLTIAKTFAESRRRPERSIVFLAVTLEESGLLGSAYYVANPIFPLKRTVAALNMDAITWGGPTRDVTVVGAGASQLEEYLARAAAKQDRVVREEPTPESGFFYRSDHFNFAKAGVPALYIKLGIEDREKGAEWARTQHAEWTLKHYHKPSDEWVPGTDLRGGLQDIALLHAVGATLAREESLPSWYANSEFRAARERSLKSAD